MTNLTPVADVSTMSNEEYALLRRYSFGASDSSILCDVNPFSDINKLLLQKLSTRLTQEEIEISEKASVRMGRDLEHVVLQKFTEATGIGVTKPTLMFELTDMPYLTINFDGLTKDNIPVEAKIVTKYGEKYYNKKSEGLAKLEDLPHVSSKQYIQAQADKAGIPAYYYTQLQQQIFGAEAPYGYLAVIFVDSWEFHLYKIVRDPRTIATILTAATKNSEYLPKKKQDQ